ncbi:ATP-dependent Clp protease proteolytic subunit [Micrococcaceae bacterium RIT802]|nr:ATP-dependent Clp protease proteolytic subunit [Micrococcaceae bacterium RIT 802]
MTATHHPAPAAQFEPRQWYRMEADPTEGSAEVYIYESIGGWFGVEASQFVRELAAMDVEKITLRVNSPGGSVYDGVAIMNAIRRHKATVTATVDGLAASAASFIIMAADEIVMGRGSELMIHDASNIVWGNAADLLEEAGHLDRVSSSIAALYAERAGGTTEDWRTAMHAETWYSAAEAVEAGLADRVDGAASKEADASAFADVTRFAHAGRGNAPAPWMPKATGAHQRAASASVGERVNELLQAASQGPHNLGQPPVPAPTGPPAQLVEDKTPTKEGSDPMSDALIKGLRERLGITADAELDDNGLLAAVDEALAEQETPTAQAPAPGTVVIDEAQHAELVANAEAGRQALARQQADDRRNLVANAVRDGRIAPARSDHWEAALAADPEGAAATLEGLAKGLVPLDAQGYTGGVNEASDEDRLYSKFYNTKEA